MKKILIQLDSDRQPSSFDAITALDAGVDHLIPYGGIESEDVQSLVYGAMFTRGPKDLKHSAVFVGGSDVSRGEAIFKAVKNAFFGPISVSVMLDSNGCNTTAAAAVAKILSKGDVTGKTVAILSGTGPVGMRAAAMLAKEGAKVTLTSRTMEKAELACHAIGERFGVTVNPGKASNVDENVPYVQSAYGVLCTGAAGILLVEDALWKNVPDLKVLADVNAVPPLGIEGIDPNWDGKEIDGKTLFGAIGIGGLKMKVHKACVEKLFQRNDLALEAEEIFAIAKQTVQES